MKTPSHAKNGALLMKVGLCVLSLLALSMSIDGLVHVGPNGAVSWAAFFGGIVLRAVILWVLYGAWLKKPNVLRPVRLWLLAVVLAAVMTLGAAFEITGNTTLLTADKWRTVLYFAGRVPLYAAAMQLLADALTGDARKGPVRLPRYATALLAGVVLVCWLPWYVCIFPGTISNDSLTQLRQAMGAMPLSNGNPVAQTGLCYAFVKAGLLLGHADIGIALYCVVQAALLAWLVGSLLNEIGRSDAPRGLFWGSLAFFALCPIFPVFAFCVGKDTNFAMAVLWLSLTVWRVMQRRAAQGVPLCLAAVCCVLLRNPGVYLAALTLAALLIWGVRHGRWKAPACALAAAAAVYAALHLAVLPSLDIAPMPETENYSIPLQHVARIAASDGLTEQERAVVEGVLPVDELKAAYRGELSDPVKDLWRKDATEESKAAFFAMWPRMVLNHPATCFSATFHNTYGYLYPGYFSSIKPTLLLGDQSSRTANAEGLFTYTVNPLSQKLKALTEQARQAWIYRVLVSPGLYGWITLFAAIDLLRKHGSIATIPAVFTLAGCMLSAVNGYFRYAMPLYLCAPLLLWLIHQSKSQDP